MRGFFSRSMAAAVIGAAVFAAGGAVAEPDTVVHPFVDGSDGAYPLASVIDEGGKIYGTTSNGGTSGYGTVFEVTSKGESVIYSFQGDFEAGLNDGFYPTASLVDVKGTLYGTTQAGGIGCGIVFQLTPPVKPSTTWTETILHIFQCGNDGFYPNGLVATYAPTTHALLALYGTTVAGGGTGCDTFGGGYGCGTVFKLTPPVAPVTTWTESVIYAFSGGSDGFNPEAGLVAAGGVLYGTTEDGGGGTGCGNGTDGCGTVFKVTTTGTETVLHAFQGGSDGAFPHGEPIDVNGAFYGTTLAGGGGTAPACGSGGCGVIYKVTAKGVETVPYAFAGGSDGLAPYGHLVDVKGTLYGTTIAGGGKADAGTVVKVTMAGHETVLHSFGGTNDGVYPEAGLFYSGGSLYGTTAYGGGTPCFGNSGCGTVFKVAP